MLVVVALVGVDIIVYWPQLVTTEVDLHEIRWKFLPQASRSFQPPSKSFKNLRKTHFFGDENFKKPISWRVLIF